MLGPMPKVVITGANRGIGRALAQQLVERGVDVVLLCRDGEAGARAERELREVGRAGVQLVLGSLDSIAAVRSSAEALSNAAPRFDVLVHNAGVWPSRRVLTSDGLELAFAVNHLAPFLLNHLLAESVTRGGRIVQVSAGIYIKGRVDLARTARGDDFGALSTYANTKLCNLLLLTRFAAHFASRGITMNALHPGVIRTGLGDRNDILGLLLRLVKRLWKSPEEGARPIASLALDPRYAHVSGRFFEVEREVELAPVARDTALADQLWQQACELTGIDSPRVFNRDHGQADPS
jgi:NAD(P)-dependent dehydrogenase (short-subunit alcohol dehydrogenase family)